MSKMSKAVAVLGIVAGLGVAALPLSSYAVAGQPGDAKTVTAQAQVGDSIELEITDPTAGTTINTITMKNVVANADPNEASATLKVKTNSINGYTITLKDADEDTALSNPSQTANIPTGVPTKGTNAWGVKAAKVGTDANLKVKPLYTTDFTSVLPASDTSANSTFVTRTGSTPAAGDEVTLTFGVTIDMSIPAATYSDNVIITAATM